MIHLYNEDDDDDEMEFKSKLIIENDERKRIVPIFIGHHLETLIFRIEIYIYSSLLLSIILR